MPNAQTATALAFTGHRPESLPFVNNESEPHCLKLKEMLYAEIIAKAEQGYTTFFTGAARGADILFAEQVLRAKESKYPHVRLICVIPHEEQANNWSEAWRERYFSMLERADDSVLISVRYTSGCFHQRNRYMVDHASALLAVYSGVAAGGTAYTVRYAQQMNKELIIINPSTFARPVVAPRLQVL